MTPSIPSKRYAKGLRRVGGDDAACAFYDVHVTADALHEQLALHDLCGGLVSAEPDLADDVVFGAAACLHVEARFAEHVLGCWQQGRSSLRAPARMYRPLPDDIPDFDDGAKCCVLEWHRP